MDNAAEAIAEAAETVAKDIIDEVHGYAESAAENAGKAADSAGQAATAADSAGVSAIAASSAATEAANSAADAEHYAEQAAQIVTGSKVWFPTPEALKEAYPTGEDGWYAIVGTTDTVWTWDSDTDQWVDSGSSGNGPQAADIGYSNLESGLSAVTMQEAIDELAENMKNIEPSQPASACPYRIGDILQTENPTPPEESWPGTKWEELTGKFLLGRSDDKDLSQRLGRPR